MNDQITVTVGGKTYAGWTSITVSRNIDHMATSFALQVSERWQGQANRWAIRPGMPVIISVGPDVVLTGYSNVYEPKCDGASHSVSIKGRGRTQDLIDCMPDIAGGQFQGYDLLAIAKALCAPFGISVIAQAPMPPPVDSVTMERAERVFEFLERLCRLGGILMTDNPQGDLVLTTVSGKRAADVLTMGSGGNILACSSTLDDTKRFSTYTLKRQDGCTTGGPIDDIFSGFGGADNTPAAGASADVPARYVATDPAITRYRPHVSIAEAALDNAGMMERVQWQARYAAAKSTVARVRVAGYRQSNGDLWTTNIIVSCNIPYLEIDQDMLIVGVVYSLSSAGAVTDLSLAPPAGYTPDPGQVRFRKHKGASGGGIDISNFGG